MPDELDALQFDLIEIEAQQRQLIGRLQVALARAQERLAEFERKVAEAEIKFYTEAEFAKALKVSQATIARMRKDSQIPYLLIRGCYVYTSKHLAGVAEYFERKPRRKMRTAA